MDNGMAMNTPTAPMMGSHPLNASNDASTWWKRTPLRRKSIHFGKPNRTTGDFLPAAASPSSWWKCDVNKIAVVVRPTRHAAPITPGCSRVGAEGTPIHTLPPGTPAAWKHKNKTRGVSPIAHTEINGNRK